jgi:PAS domain S-box-containing protein
MRIVSHSTEQFDTRSPTVLYVGGEETAQALGRLAPEIESHRTSDAESALAYVGQVDCVVAEQEFSAGGETVLPSGPGNPDADVLALFEAVRERSAHVPFVLVTDGEGDDEVVREAFRRGVTGHVTVGDGEQYSEALRHRIEVAVEHASAELERTRKRTALDGTDAPIAAVDEDGRFSYVNGAYCDLFGRSESALLGAPLSLVYPDVDAERLRDAGRGDHFGADDWYGTCVGVRGDGSTFQARTGVSQLPGGGFTMLVVENRPQCVV